MITKILPISIALGLIISLLPSLSFGDGHTASEFQELGLRTTAVEGLEKPKSIVVLVPPSRYVHRADLRDWLQQAAGGVTLHFIAFDSIAKEANKIAKADAIFGWCNADLIKQAENLAYFHNYGAGLDRCSFDQDVVKRQFVMTNGQGAAAPTMAEHVLAMMLSLSRNIHYFRDQQYEGAWQLPDAGPAVGLKGKTVLILGLGGIGREVAKRSHAMGMRVIATRNSSRQGPDYVDKVGLASETLELAKEADFVVNALPLTSNTMGVVDENFFQTMPKGGYYINVGRGRSTVTEDLINALKDGTLRGAALDVTDPEPLPQGHPLWDLPNVIITPHMSGQSDLTSNTRWAVVRENLRRYVNGEPLYNVVNLDRGY